jgi:hypothetical protein
LNEKEAPTIQTSHAKSVVHNQWDSVVVRNLWAKF